MCIHRCISWPESLKLSWMQVDILCQDIYNNKVSLLGQDKGEKLCRAEGTLIWKSWCGNGLEALLVACIFWRATTLWLHLNATPKEVKEQTMCFASAVPSAFSYSLSCFVTSPCSQQSCWWSCYRLDLYTSHSSCGWWHSVWSKSTAASC